MPAPYIIKQANDYNLRKQISDALNELNAGFANSAFLNQHNVYTKSQGSGITTLADAATIVWDADPTNIYQVTLAGNRILGAPTNLRAGYLYTLIVIQDGTGGRTLDMSNAVFKWGRGTAYLLSTAPSAVDVIDFIADASLNLWPFPRSLINLVATQYIGQNLQTGTSYTLQLSDIGKPVDIANAAAITCTIPANSVVPFPVNTRLEVNPGGAGQITMAITTDTLRGDRKSAGQWKALSLWKRATTEWVCWGGIP